MPLTDPSPENPLQGSCLCGGVRFEVTAPFLWANHCHCSRCRKHSGAFGGTQGRVPREGFRLLAGEELIRVYRPDGVRVTGWPVGTFIRGRRVMWQGELVTPSQGEPVRFLESLKA